MNYNKITGSLFFMILLYGCTNINNQKYIKILNEELSKPAITNGFHFSTKLTHTPTIQFTLSGKNLFFAVDTASVGNFMLGSKSVKQIVNKKLYKIANMIDLDDGHILSVTIDKNVFLLDPKGIFTSGLKRNPYDGFIGLTYLEQYKNVVFDYKNKVIHFNQEPICDNELPMHKKNNLWFTIIECNGVESNALIDTGCFSVFINKQNVKNTINDDQLINIKLGSTVINNISLKYNNTLVTNKNARNTIYKNENIIGYPCFKDHVIQLDFENNVFRIK
jgi:hypothetical protein